MDTGAGILANALSDNGINAIYMSILMAVLGHEKIAQMMKSGYEIVVLPDFASFLVKFKQAHKGNIEWTGTFFGIFFVNGSRTSPPH